MNQEQNRLEQKIQNDNNISCRLENFVMCQNTLKEEDEAYRKNRNYQSCLLLTQQFRFCGNAFRADTYKGCDFGCKYCFANTRGSFKKRGEIIPADLNVFEKFIHKKGSGLTQELINNCVPVHLGGMSDPFQKIEFEIGNTLKFFELFRNYPVSISTKTSFIPNNYFNLLNINFHTFQISLFTSNNFTKEKFETNTPSIDERINFMKELSQRGFWVSLRLQPLINLEEAIDLIKKVEPFIKYITIEHLKITKTGEYNLRKELASLLDKNTRLVLRRNYYSFSYEDKKERIEKIKSITKIPIGVGDNELHELSDSKNCCGIDLMPKSFKNWLRYNSMYIMMTNDRTGFIPKQKIYNMNVPSNTYERFNRNNSYKFYVEKYIEEVHNKKNELTLFGA